LIASPCNKVCVMDPERGLCRGCYRTLDEIARWGGMEDSERGEVLQELARRRAEREFVNAPRPGSE